MRQPGAALVLTCAAALAEAGDFGIAVTVAVTPAAAAALRRSGEGIDVSAWYYGDPRPGAEAQVNPVGLVDLATESAELGPDGGTVGIAGQGVASAVAWIEGPAMVNINVYSTRRHQADNVLACDFFDGALASARGDAVTLRCGLISEGFETLAKS